MTRRGTVLVAVAVAVLGVAIGVGIDLVDDGESSSTAPTPDGGVVPGPPCVLALAVEDPAVVGGGSFFIATVTGDGDPVRISGDDVATHPDISPDGERIAYVRAIGDYESAGPESTELWTMGIDGSDPTPVLSEGGYAEQPTWSPDGHTIALTRSIDGGNPEIVYVASGGSEPAVVVPAPDDGEWGLVRALTWSPDGERLAYIWRTPSSDGSADATEVRTVGIDDREVRVLADVPNASTIDWSPDGSSLLVAGGDGEIGGLHLVDPETGEVRDLAQGGSLARWAPGGSRAYAIVRNDADRPEDGDPWDLVDVAVPRGPGAAPDRTIRTVSDPYYGMSVGPTC